MQAQEQEGKLIYQLSEAQKLVVVPATDVVVARRGLPESEDANLVARVSAVPFVSETVYDINRLLNQGEKIRPQKPNYLAIKDFPIEDPYQKDLDFSPLTPYQPQREQSRRPVPLVSIESLLSRQPIRSKPTEKYCPQELREVAADLQRRAGLTGALTPEVFSYVLQTMVAFAGEDLPQHPLVGREFTSTGFHGYQAVPAGFSNGITVPPDYLALRDAVVVKPSNYAELLRILNTETSREKDLPPQQLKNFLIGFRLSSDEKSSGKK